MDQLNQIAIPINSELYWLERDAEQNVVNIKEVYCISVRSISLMMENVGRIIDNEFIDLRWTPITSLRRKNLYGLDLRASMVVTNNDTLIHLTDYR